jgi:hypothetical protein
MYIYKILYDDRAKKWEDFESIIPEEAMGALDETQSSGSETQSAESLRKVPRRRLRQRPTQVTQKSPKQEENSSENNKDQDKHSSKNRRKATSYILEGDPNAYKKLKRKSSPQHAAETSVNNNNNTNEPHTEKSPEKQTQPIKSPDKKTQPSSNKSNKKTQSTPTHEQSSSNTKKQKITEPMGSQTMGILNKLMR